jgi:hypothetical protein
MRIVLTAVASVCLAVVLACASTLKTDVGWDQNADFAKYKTWAWRPDGSIRDPVWAKRFQDVLSDQLAKNGLTQVDLSQSPDLWAVVHARLSSETRVMSYDPGWGYGYGAWGSLETFTYEVPAGSFVIDLVDVKAKRAVWQGKAKDVLSPDKTNEEREQKLVSILAQLFAGFPPTPGGPPAAKTGG